MNGSEFAVFAAIDALERGDEPEAQPFDEWFRVSEDKARRDPFFQQHYETGADWRRIEHDWLGPRDWFATVPIRPLMLQARPRRHSQGLNLPRGTLARLAQNEELGCTCREARSGRRLG